MNERKAEGGEMMPTTFRTQPLSVQMRTMMGWVEVKQVRLGLDGCSLVETTFLKRRPDVPDRAVQGGEEVFISSRVGKARKGKGVDVTRRRGKGWKGKEEDKWKKKEKKRATLSGPLLAPSSRSPTPRRARARLIPFSQLLNVLRRPRNARYVAEPVEYTRGAARNG